jgi:hypothetical protein
MMIDDDTLKQLLRINDELLQLCKFLNEKRDMETSSRLIPLVEQTTYDCFGHQYDTVERLQMFLT